MEAELKRSYELEASEELKECLKLYGDPIAIHKRNGDVHVYQIADTAGLQLFDKLHQGHDDVIDEMIQYGEYLLQEKLRKAKATFTLTLVKK